MEGNGERPSFWYVPDGPVEYGAENSPRNIDLRGVASGQLLLWRRYVLLRCLLKSPHHVHTLHRDIIGERGGGKVGLAGSGRHKQVARG